MDYNSAVDHILGQAGALQALQAQAATGRIHHAQVFHGPSGVGKFTTAIAFAKQTLCHDPVTDLRGNLSACNQCASCRLFHPPEQTDASAESPGQSAQADPAMALTWPHPDLHVVTKELALYSDDKQTRDRKLMSIPVEIVREHVVKPASLAPTMRHGKVFIVDEAELLNSTGQNVLLKTLEEPTEGTYLILITSSEHRLLPTIRSRCQRVAFHALEDPEVGRWLAKHHAEVDEQTLKWIVGFAQGSLGRAELAVRYDLVEWGTAVLTPMNRMLRASRPEPGLGAAIAECVDGFAGSWVSSHKNASKEAANRRGAALMSSMIGHYARRKLAERSQQVDAEAPASAEAALEPWLAVIEALQDYEKRLSSNVNLKLCCEGLGMAIHGALLGAGASR